MPDSTDNTTPAHTAEEPVASDAGAHGGSRWLIVVFGALAVLLIAGVAFSMLTGSDSDEQSPEEADAPASDTAPGDGSDVEAAGDAGEAQLLQTVRNDLPDDVGRTLSISPDGRWYLADTQPGSGGDAIEEICVRSVEDHAVRGCTEVGPFFDPRGVRWSADASTLVFGDDTARTLQGGDIFVMDADSGELTELTSDRPRDDSGDPDPVIYYSPSISPGGDRVAAYRTELPSRESQLVLFDLLTGDEQQVATPPEMFSHLVWEPTGDRVWANFGGPSSTLPSQATGYDLTTGEVTTIETSVASQRNPEEPARLVQVSVDGSIGLLSMEILRGEEGMRVNQAFSAVIDLQTGERAPLLQTGSDDPRAVEHAGAEASWLSPDGRYAFTAYFTGPTLGGFRGDDDPSLQLVRIPVDSILAGAPEVEVLIEDIAQQIGVNRAVTVTESPTMRLHPVPVAGDTMTFPALLPFDDTNRGGHPATFIRFEFDRDLS